MKQKLSAILSPEKRSKIFDTLRIVLLIVFTLVYTAVVVTKWFDLSSSLTKFFPTISYRTSRFLSATILAVIATVATFLIVRSFEHYKRGLRLQVPVYLCALLPLVVLVVNDSDGWGWVALLMIGIPFAALLVVQAVVLWVREAIRKKIGDRKKERILGCSLLGAFLLILLILPLILPSYINIGWEVKRILEEPGELLSADNYMDMENVAALPEQAWEALLPTLEVDLSDSDKDHEEWGNPELAVSLRAENAPDGEIVLLWWKQAECVHVLYRDMFYYADDSAFEAKLAEYLPLEQAD